MGTGRARIRPVLAMGLTVAAIAGCGGQASESGQAEGREAPFRAEVRSVAAGGTELAWYERGEGPPLVMLTGTGSTMSEWDPALLRLLARDHRLILFDYPGVGLSGPWEGRGFDSLADATAQLIEAIGVERADVLGWSMGGFVAQRLVIRHPDRVGRVVLAATNPGGRAAVLGTPAAQAIDSDPDPTDAEVLTQLYPPDRQAEGRRFLRRLARAAGRGQIPADFEVSAATTDRQVAAEDPWLRSDANWRQLATLQAPVLAAAGRRDPVTPAANMRRIAARAPSSELVVLPGAHGFLFQERRAFARIVGAFLDGSPEAADPGVG
ncbi:MAG TPA: alpha/beta hydrolase [Solirubrobacterales bacterium]|nr:alpha/beta hydrolase [Solirubrobacterales bacterium]